MYVHQRLRSYRLPGRERTHAPCCKFQAEAFCVLVLNSVRTLIFWVAWETPALLANQSCPEPAIEAKEGGCVNQVAFLPAK